MTNAITKTCSISGGDLPEGFKTNIDVTFDFNGATPADERGWAVSHLIISVQRVLKKMRTAELEKLSKDGYTVRALDAGKRASDPTPAFKANFAGKTKEEQLAEIEELKAMMRKE